MSTQALRSWTDLVKLHPDVEAGALTEAVFAIDLGAIAADDPERHSQDTFNILILISESPFLCINGRRHLGNPGWNKEMK